MSIKVARARPPMAWSTEQILGGGFAITSLVQYGEASKESGRLENENSVDSAWR